jgi:hypothetical protein
LIVGGMLTCAAIGMVQVGLNFRRHGMPDMCRCASYRTGSVHDTLRALWQIARALVCVRGVEAVVLFLMLRALLGVLRGPQPEEVFDPFSAASTENCRADFHHGTDRISSWRLASDLLDRRR